MTEKAVQFWGKAGMRSLARSALVEAEAQLTRALDLMTVLPSTPTLRREEIKLQIALLNNHVYTKGFAATAPRKSLERLRELIETVSTLGEIPDDPFTMLSLLWGIWAVNVVFYNKLSSQEVAEQFLTLAKKQATNAPFVIGHRMSGIALLPAGQLSEARAHFDRGLALYKIDEHRQLTTRFGMDSGSAILAFRSVTLALLGYPDRARADVQQAISLARETGHAPTLMQVLSFSCVTLIHLGDSAAAKAFAAELHEWSEAHGALLWKAAGMYLRGCALWISGDVADALLLMASGTTAMLATGTTIFIPLNYVLLANAHAKLGQPQDARHCIEEATNLAERSGQKFCEAEIHRTAGEIELLSPEPDLAKAQSQFRRALEVARTQQARSWELRAATSLGRLWRDQGRRAETHDLLAPVYGWFTEGFDTINLKEAKALLEELA